MAPDVAAPRVCPTCGRWLMKMDENIGQCVRCGQVLGPDLVALSQKTQSHEEEG